MQIVGVESPLGDIELDLDDDGTLVHLEIVEHLSVPLAPTGRGEPQAVSRLRAYFGGQLDAIDDIAVAPAIGTEFQRAVWSALRRVPAGETVSYGELADMVGRPRASRAVGSANGANPTGIVVPCHRVIAGDGTLGGYTGGLDRKRWLLRHEGVTVRDG